MKNKLLSGFITLVLLLSLPAGASADTTFTWTEGRFFGSGTLTATYLSGDEYLITGITGDIGNLGGILFLLPPNGYQGNDNILYYPTTPNLDDLGISFMAGAFDFNINCAASCVVITTETPTATYSDTFTAEAVPAPVVGTGLPGLIFAGGGFLACWRRKRKAQAVTN